MKFTLLGTANAGLVPVYGCDCDACQRALLDARFQRKPCSALLEIDSKLILIDAGLTDLTQRLPPDSLSCVLLTHYHLDHIAGLFSMRWGKNLRIPVIGPRDPEGCAQLDESPTIFDFGTPATALQSIYLNNLSVTPLPLCHSRPCMGYYLSYQNFHIAYLTDTAGLPQATMEFFNRHTIDIMVLDCSFPPQALAPKNHNDINLAFDIYQQLNPAACYLTHIGHDLDCWLMQHADDLPKGMHIGYDGLTLYSR